MIAAANGSQILIFDTYTAEQLCVLRGHNQRVSSLVWVDDDQKLVSAGYDHD